MILILTVDLVHYHVHVPRHTPGTSPEFHLIYPAPHARHPGVTEVQGADRGGTPWEAIAQVVEHGPGATAKKGLAWLNDVGYWQAKYNMRFNRKKPCSSRHICDYFECSGSFSREAPHETRRLQQWIWRFPWVSCGFPPTWLCDRCNATTCQGFSQTKQKSPCKMSPAANPDSSRNRCPPSLLVEQTWNNWNIWSKEV